MKPTTEPALRRPTHPLLVLLAAILLPGFGYTLMGLALRGLTMQMFMIVLGIITWQMTTPEHSLVGRLAGGLFVYAISIMDTYRLAKLRWDAFQRLAGQSRAR